MQLVCSPSANYYEWFLPPPHHHQGRTTPPPPNATDNATAPACNTQGVPEARSVAGYKGETSRAARASGKQQPLGRTGADEVARLTTYKLPTLRCLSYVLQRPLSPMLWAHNFNNNTNVIHLGGALMAPHHTLNLDQREQKNCLEALHQTPRLAGPPNLVHAVISEARVPQSLCGTPSTSESPQGSSPGTSGSTIWPPTI